MNQFRVLALAALALGLLAGCQTGPRSVSRGSSGAGAEFGTGQSTGTSFNWDGWDKPMPGPNPLGYADSPSYR